MKNAAGHLPDEFGRPYFVSCLDEQTLQTSG